MAVAKHLDQGATPHRETETAVWILIVLLLGLSAYAVLSLLERIGG